MRIYNSMTRKKETFVPLQEGKVGLYACGPTVYNYFHIGNARPFIVFDVLRRYLEYRGYEVTFVQNFTDIDDKLIRRAAEEKARALVDQQEIVRIARTRSSELMANAENKSRELRHVASDYVDDILRRSEESLAAALSQVRGSRGQFRAAAGVPEQQPAQQK